jgi:hypothetical protein
LEVHLQHAPIVSIEEAYIKVYNSEGFEQISLGDISDFLLENSNELLLFLSRDIQSKICNCEQARLTIKYTAGYELIPDCFYTTIVALIERALRQRNDCGEGECDFNDSEAFNAYLKTRLIDGESWEWAVPNNILEDSFAGLDKLGYLGILNQYSNCLNKITISTGSLLP